MIFGCGIDFINISRIKKTIETHDRFLFKIYTENEIAYCNMHNENKFAKFASRFAAKEAFLKALKTGYSNGLSFKEIEVLRSKSSDPQIKLYGKTLEFFNRTCGNANIFLSLSDDSNFAIANVIIEKF